MRILSLDPLIPHVGSLAEKQKKKNTFGVSERNRSHTHDVNNTTHDHTGKHPASLHRKRIKSRGHAVGCKIPRKENSPTF